MKTYYHVRYNKTEAQHPDLKEALRMAGARVNTSQTSPLMLDMVAKHFQEGIPRELLNIDGFDARIIQIYYEDDEVPGPEITPDEPKPAFPILFALVEEK